VDSSGHVYVASSLGVWRYTTLAQDIIVNGGFEANSGWAMPVTPRQAGYSDRVAYDGRQSVRVGIDNGSIKYAYSSARQVVTIPADATKATLSFYVYRVSSRPVYGDAQYVLILDPNTNAILRAVFWNVSNAQQWQHTTFDLMPYAGQTIVVHFGVRNDGAKGRTGMYVDDVSLVVTRPARPTSR